MEVSTGEDKVMPGNPLPRRTLGRTGLEVSVLGFGSAPVGDLYREVGEAAALETIVTALSNGVTLLDTSPFYGSGLSEHRVGSALRHVPEVKPVISTKVGRYALPSQPSPGSSFAGGLDHALQIDYGYDGAMRSIEQSLIRLGVNHLDIVLVHDLDRYTHGDNLEGYYQEALEGAVEALTKLRDEGVIRGYGVGVNEADMAERFARDCDPDAVLLAGRYSLLEQPAIESFLPLAEERNIGVLLGGVFNSGILATGPIEGARYDYSEAPPEILEKVRKMEAVCQSHNVPLRRAALQFVLGHPTVSCLVLGAEKPAEVHSQLEDLSATIPGNLWAELKHEGLLGESIPTP